MLRHAVSSGRPRRASSFLIHVVFQGRSLHFQFDVPVSNYVPSYNIAPSQEVLAVIRDDDVNRAGLLRWGLVPSWAKDPKMGYRMINARAESAAAR